MALEALSLPNWHVYCIDPIADSRYDSGNDQLHTLACRCLQNSPNHHDPASPHDTTLPPIMISSQECHDCAYETSDVIDGGDNAFELGARIVEVGAKRWQADYGAENTLVIAKKLAAFQLVLGWTVNVSRTHSMNAIDFQRSWKSR